MEGSTMTYKRNYTCIKKKKLKAFVSLSILFLQLKLKSSQNDFNNKKKKMAKFNEY